MPTRRRGRARPHVAALERYAGGIRQQLVPLLLERTALRLERAAPAAARLKPCCAPART